MELVAYQGSAKLLKLQQILDVTKSAFMDVEIPNTIIAEIDKTGADTVQNVIKGELEVTAEKQDTKVSDEVLTFKTQTIQSELCASLLGLQQ